MLTYLITGLPKLVPGMPPPMTRPVLAAKVRDALPEGKMDDFHLLQLREDIDETTRFHQSQHDGDDWGSAESYWHERKEKGREEGRFIPSWVYGELSHHALVRLWFQCIYQRAKSGFLQRWARASLNLEEMIAGHLCKQEQMSFQQFMLQMEGGFDSSWRVMVSHYDDPDLGIAGRVPRFEIVRDALEDQDLTAMTHTLDEVRWHLIDREPIETFSMDYVLAYYLKLGLLERAASFDQTKGEAILAAILNPSEHAEVVS